MYLNKVMLIGNLTKDPELKSLPSGISVTSFSVATNRIWKDKQGAKQTASDYHNVVVFGKQAGACAQFLRKGQQVFIDGRLQTRGWDTPAGRSHRTEIVADNVQFGARVDSGKTVDEIFEGIDKPAEEEKVIEYPENENLEDIPF